MLNNQSRFLKRVKSLMVRAADALLHLEPHLSKAMPSASQQHKEMAVRVTVVVEVNIVVNTVATKAVVKRKEVKVKVVTKAMMIPQRLTG